MFEQYEDFVDSDLHEEYEGLPRKCFELIDKKIVSYKVALEFYVSNEMYNGLDKDILFRLLNTYNLDINSLYNFPTDSNEPTTLLNSLCEYRHIDSIKIALELGADPNITDSIQYTPFQSLMSGHSVNDIGKNVDEIKTVIELFLKHNTKFILEKWQYDEHYKPYENMDDYFVEFAKSINIVDNVDDRFE